MQVFITNESLKQSAKELDDLRLNKQITEINQILLSYINELYVDKIGHQNHPVNLHYKSEQGVKFLIVYGYKLCIEYKFRFKKHHMGSFTLNGLQKQLEIDNYSEWNNNEEFSSVYIKGQKGKDQIITSKNVYKLYRELLTTKWNNDKVKPKWTLRGVPEWYREDVS